jgi:hypothetical protein
MATTTASLNSAKDEITPDVSTTTSTTSEKASDNGVSPDDTFSVLPNEERITNPADFWEEMEKPVDINTYIWLAGMILEVDDSSSRAFVTARSKDLVIDKVYEILTGDKVGFDGSSYTTKLQAIRGYFDGHEKRDLFLMLCPLE